MHTNKVTETSRTDIYHINDGAAQEVQNYIVKNKSRLAPFEPLRTPEYYELENIKQRIRFSMHEQENAQGVSFIVTLKGSQKIIAIVNFSNVIQGVFKACYLGFSIDKGYEGQGIMHEVLENILNHVRTNYSLHRVMANHLPDNEKSAKLLQKLGFEREGFAKSYLKINGRWQDHVLNSLVFEEHEASL